MKIDFPVLHISNYTNFFLIVVEKTNKKYIYSLDELNILTNSPIRVALKSLYCCFFFPFYY